MVAHSNPILSSVITVYDKLRGSKLEESVLYEIDDSIVNLMNFLNIDNTEAIFCCFIFLSSKSR